MGRKSATQNRRPQTQKDREKARAIQELRRSSAAEPMLNRARYSRNDFRRSVQAGSFGWDD